MICQTRQARFPALFVTTIALLFSSCWSFARADGDDQILFTNLSARNGMSGGAVHRILFDNEGVMWFGTESGLTQFNGINLEAWELKFDSLGMGGLRALAADRGGWFWIGTAGDGLLRYQPKTGKSIWHREDSSKPGSLSHDSVTALHLEAGGALWVGTERGLNLYSRETTEFIRIPLGDPAEPKFVRSILADEEGALWVATAGNGLFRQDSFGEWNLVWNQSIEITALAADTESGVWIGTPGSGLFRIGPGGAVMEQIETEAHVISLLRDSKGTLWAGTSMGLGKYRAKTDDWSWYRHDSQDERSIVPGPITTIFEDKRAVLWIGSTNDGGVSRFSLTQTWFPRYSADSNDPTTLSHSAVHGFSSSKDGSVWVGTERGLNRFDPNTGESTRFLENASKAGSLPRNFAPLVMEDSRGRLWVGTSGGLARRDPGADEFVVYRNIRRSIHSIPGDSITALLEADDGSIWVAARGNGVARWDEESDTFERFESSAAPAVRRHVTDFFQDRAGRIWVATESGGLWNLDPDYRTWTHYRRFCTDPQAQLPSENITDLAESKGGRIWIGMRNGGFSRLDPNSGELRNFTPKNARLPHADTYALAEDDNGLLWAATGAGLIQFNPAAAGFRRFGPSDGLQSPIFYPKSIHKAPDGRIFVGGPGGFNIVDPGNLPKPLKLPRPLLTKLRHYGNPIDHRSSDILEKPLAATESFDIAYDPGLSLTIEFGTMNYATSGQTRYQYKLEGYDGAWRNADETQKASYTRLDPGTYEFLVQSRPDDASDWLPDKARVEIRVLPPWYQSRIAVISFVVGGSLLVALVGIFLYRGRMARERTRRQQLENERSQAEAALARQIQRSMLLERTSAEFRRGIDSAEMFNATLSRLAEHFRVAHCFIASCVEGDEGFAQILAEFHQSDCESFGRREIPTATPVMRTVLESDEPLAIDRRAALTPNDVAPFNVLGDEKVQSLLALRTVHSDRPNGLIVLHHKGESRSWSEEEIKMLRSLAGQIGIAIAQFQAREREEKHKLELEEARQAADAANDAKSEFLAKMTHEVRTPLNAILGFTEVMTQDGELTNKQRNHLDIINSSGEHLLGVINDILEVSKIEAGGIEINPEVFDLEQLLRSVVGMIQVKADAKGIGLEVANLTELPSLVETDKGKLRQILLNLLGNAVKFTEKGGVALRVGMCGAEPADPLQPNQREVRLEFEVFDTGPGIPEADQAQLFQKFVQTETGKRATQGTGLGLAISKSFAELMGGQISLMSRVGFGTLFTVEIPCVEHVQAAPSEEAKTSNSNAVVVGLEPGHDEVRVLVAEDQPLNRLLMNKLLSSAGFALAEAEDGAIAVEKWREWRPHIIFMDEDMPNLRGTDATRQILAEAPPHERPVVVSLTAFAMEDQRKAAMEAGCSEFLAKPFKREELFEVIARMLPVRYSYRDLDEAA